MHKGNDDKLLENMYWQSGSVLKMQLDVEVSPPANES